MQRNLKLRNLRLFIDLLIVQLLQFIWLFKYIFACIKVDLILDSLFVQVTGSGSVFVGARGWLWDSQLCTPAWQYGHPGSGLGLHHIWQVCSNEIILLSYTIQIASELLQNVLLFKCLFWLNIDFFPFLVFTQCPLFVCGKSADRHPDHCTLRPTEALSKYWIGHHSVTTAGLSSWKWCGVRGGNATRQGWSNGKIQVFGVLVWGSLLIHFKNIVSVLCVFKVYFVDGDS